MSRQYEGLGRLPELAGHLHIGRAGGRIARWVMWTQAIAVAPCWTALLNTSRGCAKAEVAMPDVTSTSFLSRFLRLRHKTQNFSTSKPRLVHTKPRKTRILFRDLCAFAGCIIRPGHTLKFQTDLCLLCVLGVKSNP